MEARRNDCNLGPVSELGHSSGDSPIDSQESGYGQGQEASGPGPVWGTAASDAAPARSLSSVTDCWAHLVPHAPHQLGKPCLAAVLGRSQGRGEA